LASASDARSARTRSASAARTWSARSRPAAAHRARTAAAPRPRGHDLRIGATDVVQRIDQQPLGNRAAAIDQPAQLQVDARQHPLQVDIDLDGAGFERVEQTAYDPPEAARQPALRQPLEVAQGIAHVASRVLVGGITQELEQCTLEPGAPNPQLVGGQRPHLDLCGTAAAASGRGTEVGRMHARRADQLSTSRYWGNRRIGWSVWPGTQAFEVGDDGLQRAFDGAAPRTVCSSLGAFPAAGAAARSTPAAGRRRAGRATQGATGLVQAVARLAQRIVLLAGAVDRREELARVDPPRRDVGRARSDFARQPPPLPGQRHRVGRRLSHLRWLFGFEHSRLPPGAAQRSAYTTAPIPPGTAPPTT
jgi:hypothetical protein